jgi:hypothetical protein
VKKEIFTIRRKIQPYKNLAPSFFNWIMHANSRIISDYKMELSATALYQESYINIPVSANATYYFEGVSSSAEIKVIFRTVNSSGVSSPLSSSGGVVVTPSDCVFLRLIITNTSIGEFVFENPILVLGGSRELEFIPKEESVIRERLKDNGQVQEVRVRFYPGVERTLQVSPYVLHKNNRREDFFTYPEGTEPYITGDNDYLIFPCSLDFQYDDEICIEYNHAGGDFPYTLAVDVVVTYHEAEVIA